MRHTDITLSVLKAKIADKYGLILNSKQAIYLQDAVTSNASAVDRGLWADMLSDENHPQWGYLEDHLAVHETYFFRNQKQFSDLQQSIIPALIRKKGVWDFNANGTQRPSIRVWSAGCSSGEEPYSIAISVAESVRFVGAWQIHIDASDMSAHRLAVARHGRYPLTDRLVGALNDMNPSYLKRYFRHVDDHHVEVADQLKKWVHFKQVNLKAFARQPDYHRPLYDLIFCRNVMIYFSYDDQKLLVDMLTNMLLPGGYLFVGDAETLFLYSRTLTVVDAADGLIYQKPTPH